MLGEWDRVQPGQQQPRSVRGGEASGHPNEFDAADDARHPQLCRARPQPLIQRRRLRLADDQLGQRRRVKVDHNLSARSSSRTAVVDGPDGSTGSGSTRGPRAGSQPAVLDQPFAHGRLRHQRRHLRSPATLGRRHNRSDHRPGHRPATSARPLSGGAMMRGSMIRRPSPWEGFGRDGAGPCGPARDRLQRCGIDGVLDSARDFRCREDRR